MFIKNFALYRLVFGMIPVIFAGFATEAQSHREKNGANRSYKADRKDA
jgi:hypothetical protein